MDELLCILDCVDVIPERYDLGNCKPEFRPFGYQGFLLIKCGVTFTDIMDVSEWVTKIEAGDVLLAPSFGTWTPGTATTSTIVGGCGEIYTEFAETPITFTTPSTKDDYTDEDWWHAFDQNSNGYTLGYMNCEGRLYLNDAAVTAIKAWTTGDLAFGNPGFNFNVTAKPQWVVGPNGVGRAGIWSTALSIIQSEVHRSVEIAGLATALKETVQTEGE